MSVKTKDARTTRSFSNISASVVIAAVVVHREGSSLVNSVSSGWFVVVDDDALL